MSPQLLVVENARKFHGTREALGGVDLELGDGEWVGLLGPNGAGKTTLMHSIAALTPLDGGSISVDGRRVGDATRPLVGFVPQEIALYGALTVRENLEVFARWQGVEPDLIPERSNWALEWTGLDRRADARVETLSGGMKRRLNIACGVLHQPRLVLLDEPTVGVDPQGRRRIVTMLESLRARGTTLLQSTHQLDEVEQSCDRVLIVDAGRIVAAGPLSELVQGALGAERIVEFALARPPGPVKLPAGLTLEGLRLRGAVAEITKELPALLAELDGLGLELRDVHVGSPSLESVLLALTGRELSE